MTPLVPWTHDADPGWAGFEVLRRDTDRSAASDAPCLLTIHAHPDDEASKGAATLARYGDNGVRTVLVCCTGGEEGDILNPVMDRPEVRADLAGQRRSELLAAADEIGFDTVVLLGFPDSGMPDEGRQPAPDSFAGVDLCVAVERLTYVLRSERPDALITYPDDQQGYRHPDHLRVFDATWPAIEAAADPTFRPDLGAEWDVNAVYYSLWSRQRMEAVHSKMLELGLESPFGPEWFERPSLDHRITTRIDIAEHHGVRRSALLAHATQIDPESPFWFGLPEEVARTVHPYDDFIRVRPEWSHQPEYESELAPFSSCC